ncbi:cell division topological specificity factor MinE [Shewanella violacea]|uniref:Cell division topological specificity factor n=1 Tax=Shewanella violacea (strain JCM 10179 / CIP 106290 / LMG 19151 / DSS12) TaxID=637905 RepID=D4ZL91_SHEVD|nr:cell division topological specificity factor MinE [Shewanella violacea]BAJ02440.1 cell division topological specificity factor MinE [Shewanella violacea DSS12]
MSLLDYFKTKKKPSSTASTAKERLQIIVAHQRGERGAPDYFPQMKQEIIEVIRKYVKIETDQISVELDQNDDRLSVLELNVTLPEK